MPRRKIDGGRSFEEVAKETLEGPRLKPLKGGDFGLFSPRDKNGEKSFADAAFSLKKRRSFLGR
jgi:hypothetical protein